MQQFQATKSSRSMASLASDRLQREGVTYSSPQLPRKNHQGDGYGMGSASAIKIQDGGEKATRRISQQPGGFEISKELYDLYLTNREWAQSAAGYGPEHSMHQAAMQMQMQSIPQQQYAVQMGHEGMPDLDRFREAGDSMTNQHASEKRLSKTGVRHLSQAQIQKEMAKYGYEGTKREPKEDIEDNESNEESTSEESSDEGSTEEESESDISSEPHNHEKPMQPNAEQQGAVNPQQWNSMQQYLQSQSPYYQQQMYQQQMHQQQMHQQQVYLMQEQAAALAAQQAATAMQQQQAQTPHPGAIYPRQVPIMAQQQYPQMQLAQQMHSAASHQSLSDGRKKVYFAPNQQPAMEQHSARLQLDPRSYSRTSLLSQGSLSSSTNTISPLLRPIMPLKQQTKTRVENMCLALNVVLFSVLAGVVAAFIVQQFSR